MKVTLTNVHVDYGDKRSYGEFEIEAETPLGTLHGKGNIDSGGGTDREEWTIDGVPVDEDADLPDLGIPHYYAGSRAIARFEKGRDEELTETLEKWLDGYAADHAVTPATPS